MTDPEMIQVVFLSELTAALDEWLDSRGLMRFRIPVGQDDPLPTYGLTPKYMPYGDVNSPE